MPNIELGAIAREYESMVAASYSEPLGTAQAQETRRCFMGGAMALLNLLMENVAPMGLAGDPAVRVLTAELELFGMAVEAGEA